MLVHRRNLSREFFEIELYITNFVGFLSNFIHIVGMAQNTKINLHLIRNYKKLLNTGSLLIEAGNTFYITEKL